jgi:hypothetical protein
MDVVDLYVDGAAFYAGSTVKDLRNGWCNLRKLGAELASRVFGPSVGVGAFYYLNGPIQPIIRASYDEPFRKQLYMSALWQEARPIIIQHPDEAGTKRLEDGPCALVIAAGTDGLSPIEAAVRARYDTVALTVPPDLPDSGFGRRDEPLKHDDLLGAQLGNVVCGPEEQYRWNAYTASREQAGLVSASYETVQTVVRGFFENELKKCQGGTPPRVVMRKLQERVERELGGAELDSRLVRSCRRFVTEKLVTVTVERLAGLGEVVRLPRVQDAQSGPRLHRVEVTEGFEKDLLRLDRRDPVIGELAKQRISDFRAGWGQPGLRLHRMERTKDLWSLSVNLDFRIIAHRASGAFTLCFVGHHAEADRWLKRR